MLPSAACVHPRPGVDEMTICVPPTIATVPVGTTSNAAVVGSEKVATAELVPLEIVITGLVLQVVPAAMNWALTRVMVTD